MGYALILHQRLHELPEAQYAVRATCAGVFVVSLNHVRCDARIIYYEWYRLTYVYALLYRSVVVWKDGYLHRLVPVLHFFLDRAYHA